MLATLLQLAAIEGEAETSKTPFYVAGAVLAGWAVLVAVLGIMREETFPASSGAKAGVMAISAVLVVATMATSILTS